MYDFPVAVLDAFARLKESAETALLLRKLNKHYYVYKTSSTWDKSSKKVVTKQEYIGRITERGAFIKRAEPWFKTGLRRAMRVVQANGGQIVFHGQTEAGAYPEHAETEKALSAADRQILTILSMNARVPLSFIARKVGMTSSKAGTRVRNLERRYGIRYIAEINTEKLGYLYYITLVKFTDKLPTTEYIKAAVEKEPGIQLAFSTRGGYDLVFFSLSKDSREIAHLVTRLLAGAFKSYTSKWYTSTYYSAYGFIPIREQFFELLNTGVWKRTRETPRPKVGELAGSEYAVLKELAVNGSTSFPDIDDKHSLVRGSAQHAFHKLVEAGIIKRTTITMDGLPIKYGAMLIATILNGEEFAGARSNFFFDLIQETPGPTNKYAASGDIEVPKSIFSIMPVFKEGDLETVENSIREKVKGIHLRSLITTNTILGSLCYRRFDNSYSKHYKSLVERYGLLQQKKREDYAENYIGDKEESLQLDPFLYL